MSLGHLRPLSFGEILDGAFVLYRRHFAALFVATLVAFVPTILFWIVVGLSLPAGMDPLGSIATFVIEPYSIVAPAVVWGALMYQVSQAYLGGEVSVGAGYRIAFRRSLALLVALVIYFVLFMLGLVLLIVPGIIATIVLFAVWQAIVLEGKGPFAAVSRSLQLARGAWKRIFGLTVVSMIIAFMPSILGTATMFWIYGMETFNDPIMEIASDLGWAYLAMNVLNDLLSALTYPYFAAVMVLLYYDRRVRTEALDLEMATDRLAGPVSA